MISLTGLDEENLLLSLFAMKHSQAKVIAKVNHIAFNDIIGGLDIGSVIYPKYLTANKIIKYVRGAQNSMGSNVETLYKILDNQAGSAGVFHPPGKRGHPDTAHGPESERPSACLLHQPQRPDYHPQGPGLHSPGDTVMVVTTHRGLQDINDILMK